MKNIILTNRENCRFVEEETKYEFTIYILESIGLPVEQLSECFPEGGYKDFSSKYKIKLRELLNKYDVSIIDNRDGELKFYVDKDMIAHWKKSHFILKRDLSELKRENQLYIEIHTEYWTIFEEK